MIYQGNAFDLFWSVEDKSIDAVITDPPYGTTSCSWDTVIDLELFWREVKRVLKDEHSPVVVFADQPFTSNLVMSNIKWFRHDWIWDKTHITGALQARVKPFKHTEDIVVFSQKKANYYWEAVVSEIENPKEKRSTHADFRHATIRHTKDTYTNKHTGFPKEVLTCKAPRGKRTEFKHPTEKPVELIEYLLPLYTKEGDTVLDPFMGSGTTGVACKNLNREFIGFELEQEYFELARGRLAS